MLPLWQFKIIYKYNNKKKNRCYIDMHLPAQFILKKKKIHIIRTENSFIVV